MGVQLKQEQSGYAKLQKLARLDLFKSVKVYPSTVTFDGQDTHETIILFLRQHPIVLVPDVFRSFLVFGIGVILALGLSALAQSINIKLGAINFVLLTLVIVISLANLLFSFLKWYYTVFLITDTRLVDLDFLTLFNATLSTTLLSVVQDVSHSTPGFFSTVFDMGSLVIQTAGEKQKFEIANIPRPRDVQDILLDLIENQRNGNSNL